MMREFKPGAVYRHFKDKLYKAEAVAEHTETGEQLAIYTALYPPYKTYARPLEMFLEEIPDRPDNATGQKYRMEMTHAEMSLSCQNCKHKLLWWWAEPCNTCIAKNVGDAYNWEGLND